MKSIIWGWVIQKEAKYAHIRAVISSFITNGGVRGVRAKALSPLSVTDRQENERGAEERKEGKRKSGPKSEREDSLYSCEAGPNKKHGISFLGEIKTK